MGKIKEKKEELRKQKEEFLSQRFKVLHKESDHQQKNHLDQAREKGASTFNTTTERPQLCSEQAGVPRQHTPKVWLEDPRSAL